MKTQKFGKNWLTILVVSSSSGKAQELTIVGIKITPNIMGKKRIINLFRDFFMILFFFLYKFQTTEQRRLK